MLTVNKLTKIDERMCYDSWWLVETDQGTARLHQFDNTRPEELKIQIQSFRELKDIQDLVPTFYFD